MLPAIPLLALKRYAPAIIGALATVFVVYNKGRSDCATKHAKQEAVAAEKWAGRVIAASAEAFKRGQAAAKADEKNKEIADDITEKAAAEVGADDICLSADIVERLRELQ